MELRIMAISIETQVRAELSSLEDIVTAVEKLGDISHSLQPEHMSDYSYLSIYLGTELQRQFQVFHKTVSKELLPFVVGVKTLRE
jgi:hypothetical protein